MRAVLFGVARWWPYLAILAIAGFITLGILELYAWGLEMVTR